MTDDDMNIGETPDVHDDETLRDVVAALSPLPVVAESEIQRIVARAAAEAVETGRRGGHRWAAARPGRELRDAAPARPVRRWYTSVPMAAAATMVLAAGIGGFAIRDATRGGAASPTAQVADAPAATGARTSVPVSAAVPDARAEAPIATQFVLDAPEAARVSLVGAFNSWDGEATPLVRDPATGLWTVTVPLSPGRHVYAFMLNDSTLTLDPRAPETRDPDFGTPGSVILVGTP